MIALHRWTGQCCSGAREEKEKRKEAIRWSIKERNTERAQWKSALTVKVIQSEKMKMRRRVRALQACFCSVTGQWEDDACGVRFGLSSFGMLPDLIDNICSLALPVLVFHIKTSYWKPLHKAGFLTGYYTFFFTFPLNIAFSHCNTLLAWKLRLFLYHVSSSFIPSPALFSKRGNTVK